MHIPHNANSILLITKIHFLLIHAKCTILQLAAALIVIHYNTHTQPFYSSMDFVRDNPGEPVPDETFTPSHLSWPSIVPYLLHPPNTIHGILPVQSMRLTIFFHNLSPSFLWSTSWPGTIHFILRTFLHPIIVFHCN